MMKLTDHVQRCWNPDRYTRAEADAMVAELSRLTYRQLRTECLWANLDLSGKTKADLLAKIRRRLCCAIAAREETAAG